MPVGAAFGGTLVTGGCGWREPAAVDGTPVGVDVLFGMVDGFNNNLDLTVEDSLPALWSDCTPSSLVRSVN